MNQKRNILRINSSEINNLKVNQYNVIVVNTFFNESEIKDHSLLFKDKITNKRINQTNLLIKKASSLLKDGGLLFVYGLPKYLPIIGKYLNFLKLNTYKLYFKYWISVELQPKKNNNSLANSHIGILMYLKSKDQKYRTPFYLNTKSLKIPYNICKACNKNLKDWGGKKHLMNPLGSAISDVWLDQINENNFSKIPSSTLHKIYDLTKKKDIKFLLIKQDEKFPLVKKRLIQSKEIKINIDRSNINKVILGDSLDIMDKYSQKYPLGLFDLAFADPPYNLGKNYNTYDDEKKSYEYVKWCNQWIEGMLKVLKPGGALMLLNIPKWAIFHAEFLLNKAEFRHWIVWNALSSPTGKIMPAHYSLLYFTKPGGKHKNNFRNITEIDARYYCNRINCKKIRKENKEDDKEILSDIWCDIFRIKHKKDRDKHPCQLPLKLMERIIKLTTNEGDLIYDPFGGAGTTAIAAKLKKRNYVISDLDENYVKIANENLKRIQKDCNGNFYYAKRNNNNVLLHSTKNKITKKEVEKAYMDICQKFDEIIDLNKLEKLSPSLYCKIFSSYDDFNRLKKITKRMMEAYKIANNITQKTF